MAKTTMTRMIRSLLLMAILFEGLSASATSYRLDFGGQTSLGAFGGYFVFDYSVADSDPDPLIGRYFNVITELHVEIDGVSYDSFDGGTPFLTAVLDSANGVADYFGVGGGVSNDTGDVAFIAVQFQNLDGTVISSDQLPTELNFADFDPYDPLNSNSNSTGAVVGIPGSIPGLSFLEFVALDFAQLYPVPVPAALWLFTSGVTVLLGAGRRRRRLA